MFVNLFWWSRWSIFLPPVVQLAACLSLLLAKLVVCLPVVLALLAVFFTCCGSSGCLPVVVVQLIVEMGRCAAQRQPDPRHERATNTRYKQVNFNLLIQNVFIIFGCVASL